MFVKAYDIHISDGAAAAFGHTIHAALSRFNDRIARRCPAVISSDNAELNLEIIFDGAIEADGFRLDGSDTCKTVAASTPSGLVAGLGKLLHTSRYGDAGLEISPWEGVSVPDCRLRGVQMDTHFCNFYHVAPKEELENYVADLAFWGVNYLEIVFPVIDLTGWDDPELLHITGQIKTICTEAKSLGMKVGLEIVPNQDFVVHREEFAATPNIDLLKCRGDNGHNLCAATPAALEYMSDLYAHVVELLAQNGALMDFLCFWPYDEGGCGCEACRPWGSNGFLKASRAIYEKVKRCNPHLEVILSTWLFNEAEGEWSGLSRAMEQDHSWVDYILADSHSDFPEYPLTHPTPGGLPLLNYPEISMWGLYPWGGYGSNPLPRRFERLWQQAKPVVSGGLTYSEGRFDDMNKVVCTQFYWNADTTAEATLREYLAYEMSEQAADALLAVVFTVEELHTETVALKHPVRNANVLSVTAETCEKADKNLAALEQIKETLPLWVQESWRFRLLYDRVKLDKLRFTLAYEKRDTLHKKTDWFEVLKGNEEAIAAVRDVTALSYNPLRYEENHPMFAVVRPPLREMEG